MGIIYRGGVQNLANQFPSRPDSKFIPYKKHKMQRTNIGVLADSPELVWRNKMIVSLRKRSGSILLLYCSECSWFVNHVSYSLSRNARGGLCQRCGRHSRSGEKPITGLRSESFMTGLNTLLVLPETGFYPSFDLDKLLQWVWWSKGRRIQQGGPSHLTNVLSTRE